MNQPNINNSIGPLIIKIKHEDGEAFIQIEDINQINFTHKKDLIITFTYGEFIYRTDAETALDLVTKWKKYKEDVKQLIMSQMV